MKNSLSLCALFLTQACLYSPHSEAQVKAKPIFAEQSLAQQKKFYNFNNLCLGKKENCRPPQFVNMGFDGAKSNSMYYKTRQFAKEHNIQFTYFASAVYFLRRDSKKGDFSHLHYNAPKKGVGRSNIGFGDSLDDVRTRYRHMTMAHEEGHEIASHAVGHFYGGAPNKWKKDALNWTSSQWASEFTYFDKFLKGGYANFGGLFTGLGIKKSQSQISKEISQNIVGFRAPQLSYNSSMFSALASKGFKYDTSKSQGRDRWPRRGEKGIWNFALGIIPVSGYGNIISMDYNLHVKKVPADVAIKAYLKYFRDNYNGNRAPVHLGHHFAAYGGYVKEDPKFWYVLKKVSEKICGLPEVFCTSFRNLETFMSSAPASALTRFQKGQFAKGKSVHVAAHLNDNLSESALPSSALGFASPAALSVSPADSLEVVAELDDVATSAYTPLPEISAEEIKRLESEASCGSHSDNFEGAHSFFDF